MAKDLESYRSPRLMADNEDDTGFMEEMRFTINTEGGTGALRFTVNRCESADINICIFDEDRDGEDTLVGQLSFIGDTDINGLEQWFFRGLGVIRDLQRERDDKKRAREKNKESKEE